MEDRKTLIERLAEFHQWMADWLSRWAEWHSEKGKALVERAKGYLRAR